MNNGLPFPQRAETLTHFCVDFFLFVFFAGRLDDFCCEASGNAGLLVLSTEVERVGFRDSNQIELRGFNHFFVNSN